MRCNDLNDSAMRAKQQIRFGSVGPEAKLSAQSRGAEVNAVLPAQANALKQGFIGGSSKGKRLDLNA
jgi:hypothetical protein